MQVRPPSPSRAPSRAWLSHTRGRHGRGRHSLPKRRCGTATGQTMVAWTDARGVMDGGLATRGFDVCCSPDPQSTVFGLERQREMAPKNSANAHPPRIANNAIQRGRHRPASLSRGRRNQPNQTQPASASRPVNQPPGGTPHCDTHVRRRSARAGPTLVTQTARALDDAGRPSSALRWRALLMRMCWIQTRHALASDPRRFFAWQTRCSA